MKRKTLEKKTQDDKSYVECKHLGSLEVSFKHSAISRRILTCSYIHGLHVEYALLPASLNESEL